MRKGDFVGGPLADGPFDQGDHAIEERLAGAGRDLHHDAVGKDPRAAGHAGAVAAGLADHGGRFAGDGRFVDRGHAFDDLAVAGNHFARDDLDHVARLQGRGDGFLDRAVGLAAAGRGRPAGLPQGVGLGLAAGLGNRRGEVGEQQRRHQPEVQGQQVSQAGGAGDAADLGHGVDERQHRADLDHEHHRVLPLDVRPEHHQRLPKGRLQELRFEEARLAAVPPAKFEFLRRRAGGLRFKGCSRHCIGCWL